MIIIYGNIIVKSADSASLYPDDALFPDENVFPLERTVGDYLYFELDVKVPSITMCQNITIEEV